MAIVVLALAALATRVSPPQTYTNPAQNHDLPDPSVIRDGGAFWMTRTMGGPDIVWPLYR